MDFGSILIILSLLILVALYVGYPLIEGKNRSLHQVEQQASILMAERDRIISAMRDLEFDHSLQKIPDEDYLRLHELLKNQGVDILRKIDEYWNDKRKAPELRVENPFNDVISPLKDDDGLEVIIAERRRNRQEKMAGFCSQCGSPLQKADEYCWKCGSKLK
jgi:hypothetical protein